ncbi:AraC family transcriptional regulator [Bacillus sp. JCM 19041]|uniref:AraC family transcriptional regulator n=1 Tax=Bacillus sp. JCM 19041 TaxID=1460637 RepID=UPI00336AC7EF
MRGELTIETNSGKCQLDQQTIFFVPVNCEHTFSSNHRNEFLVLDIPNDMVSTHFNRGHLYQMNDKWKMIRSLVLSEMKPVSSDQTSLKALIPYIFHHLQFGKLPRSVQYIHDHYDESISLERLANLEHYHVSYYSNWFFKKMGKTPSLYIQEIRFEKAKELLRHTDLSILKISMNVGWIINPP